MFYNCLKTRPNFFLQRFKNKIIFNFVKFVATKKSMKTIFFHPSLLLRFLDPGSEIRDPGWVKNQDPVSRINIPDPQHCKNPVVFFVFFNKKETNFLSFVNRISVLNLQHPREDSDYRY
jgi:hypothetical protein